MRESALYVVEYVAGLLNDPSYETFTQTQILDALDVCRIELNQIPVYGIAKKSSSTTNYYSYEVEQGQAYIETDATFEDSTYTALSPDTKDYKNGRFTFTAAQTNSYILVSGFSHDPYGAAASLLEVASNQAAGDMLTSFSARTGSFAFASKQTEIVRQIGIYRSKSRSAFGHSSMFRDDVNICL